MAWQFDSSQPVYQQLVKQIKEKIASGSYGPGVKLPAVRGYAADTGVNPNTLQRALQQLEAEGLVYTQSTSGRFVTEDTGRISALKLSLAEERVARFMADMKQLGLSEEESRQLIENYRKEETCHGNTDM